MLMISDENWQSTYDLLGRKSESDATDNISNDNSEGFHN